MIPGHDYIGVGVGVLILNDEDEIFLARRGPKARNEKSTWEFPGGGVEYGETLSEAIKREIFEEFGIKIVLTSLLGAFDHILHNEHWVSITFIGRYISGTPKILEPEKCDSIGWFQLEQLPKPLSQVTKDNLTAYLSRLELSKRS